MAVFETIRDFLGIDQVAKAVKAEEIDDPVHIESPMYNTVIEQVRNYPQTGYGLLPISVFEETDFGGGDGALGKTNLPRSIIEIAVDCLSRLMFGDLPQEAFFTAVWGVRLLKQNADIDEVEYMRRLIEIVGMSSPGKELKGESIIAACQLAGYARVYFGSIVNYEGVRDIIPDKRTIEAIRVMVSRVLFLFTYFGSPMTCPSFASGYAGTIVVGDGDYLTKNTLWTIKYDNHEPDKRDTLQAAVYLLMAKHTKNAAFRKIRYAGIFNPRLNKAWRLDLSSVPKDAIEEIESKVIGYDAPSIESRKVRQHK